MADGSVVFLFDENTPVALVRSLRELGQSAFHVYDDQVGLKHAPDEIVLKYAAERGWGFVSRDRRILRSPQASVVIRQMNMASYFFNPSLDTLCSIARAIYRNWPEMKRLARQQQRPFVYLIKENSVRPMRAKLG